MNIYYVYQYVREDQTPYYIGKGKDDRAWKSHRRSNGAEIKPKDINRIQILIENLSEQEAWDLETELIAKYGLKSEGGILVNMKEGGQGGTPSKELREHLSKILTGKKKPPRTEQHSINQSLAQKGIPKPKVSEALKGRKQPKSVINKKSKTITEWYNTINKEAKAWNSWHTRYMQDYNEYARAIKLLQEYPIIEVSRQVKFQRDNLRKLKKQDHGVFQHFPELRIATTV
jgi:hypothetical protein